MINTKLNLLPIELLNYIWNFEGTREDRYNKCVIELNNIFNKFNKVFSNAQAMIIIGKGRWPMNEMLPIKFLRTYQNKPHHYFLEKIKENKYTKGQKK